MVNRFRWRLAPATLPLVGAYALVSALGVALAHPSGGASLLAASRDGATAARDVALGALLALPALGLGWWLERVVPSLKALAREVRAALGSLGVADAAALSLASAVGEELLFRAALLPALGVWPSALLFGAAHGFFRAPYRAWSAYATGMGVVLGLLTQATGTILAAVVLHASINYVSLLDLVPGAPASTDAEPPGTGDGSGGD